MPRHVITKKGVTELRAKAKEIKRLRAIADKADKVCQNAHDVLNAAEEEFKSMAVDTLDLSCGGIYRTVSVPQWLVDIVGNL